MKKISKPYQEANVLQITQGFNFDTHRGLDLAYKLGTYLIAPENCVVEKIITPATFDGKTDSLARGYGISLKSSIDNSKYLYWHCLPVFPVKEGDIVLKGDIIGQLGNSGFVLSNGVYVPIEKRTIVPFSGAHLHFEMMMDNVMVNPTDYIDWDAKAEYNLNWIGKQILAMMKIAQNIKNILNNRR